MAVIRFRLDARSGMPIYRQIVDQVRHAVRLGLLEPGDRLPTVREVVTHIPVNPNTVHRAYRDLEAQGIVEGRAGQGTFVLRSLPRVPPGVSAAIRHQMASAITVGLDAGLDAESIDALYAVARGDALGNPGKSTTGPRARKGSPRRHDAEPATHIPQPTRGTP